MGGRPSKRIQEVEQPQTPATSCVEDDENDTGESPGCCFDPHVALADLGMALYSSIK
jgi:hypothetical protein